MAMATLYRRDASRLYDVHTHNAFFDILVYTQIQTIFDHFSEKRIIFAENIHCFMMTKQEHIDHWVRTAAEDWITVETLFTGERYMHCLFWSHLTLEKEVRTCLLKMLS
jgi:hypothetical protein